MTKTKWTPGPWFYTGQHIWYDSRELVCCGRGHGECCGEPDVKGGQELIAQTGENNAALISAAPELYEALYWLAQEETPYPIGQPYQHWLDIARAALAKARGEAP